MSSRLSEQGSAFQLSTKPSSNWFVVLALAVALLLLANCESCLPECEEPPPPRERICDDGVDNDGDLLVDCDDPDCSEHPNCIPPADGDADADTDEDTHEICDNFVDDDRDGWIDCDDSDCAFDDACVPASDGDADSDTDSDVEADSDGDADPDIDMPECDRDCSGEPLRRHCEIGDCTESGENYECCVARDTICSTEISVGDFFEPGTFEINFRGFYNNDYGCETVVHETAGYLIVEFEVWSRPLPCAPGCARLLRARLRLVLGEFEVGTTYDLCGEDAMPGMQISVNTITGDGIETEWAFHNIAGDGHGDLHCEATGHITITAFGEASGDVYEFNLEGRLMTIDESGDFAGETLDLVLSSEGLVAYE